MKTITTAAPSATSNGGFLAALLRPFGFIFRAIWLPLRPILGAVWQLLVWLLYLPLETVLRLTPLGALIQRLTGCHDPLPRLERQARAIVERLAGDEEAVDPETALLVRGERRAYAERIAPPAKCPTLYMDVPDDMRRSIVQDGKLLNDEAPAPRLAGGTLTPEFIQQAWAGSVRIATKAAYLTLVFGVLVAFAASVVLGGLSAERERAGASADLQPSQAVMGEPAELAAKYQDLWKPADTDRLTSALAEDGSGARLIAPQTQAKVAGWTSGVVLFVLLVIAMPVLGSAIGWYVFLGRLRFLVFGATDAAVNGLRFAWREPLQRHAWRRDIRELVTDSVPGEVKRATEQDRSPLLDLGEALGKLELRGHLRAAQRHQRMRMSVVDLMSHLAVTGGSGSGKTRQLLVPLTRQLLELRQQGYPIPMYITDDKGALVPVIVALAREVGLPDEDVLVIGTGPNDYRIDLLDGLDPVTLADVFVNVANQADGNAGDAFWKHMAGSVMAFTGIVLRAAECTTAGMEWVRQHGIRMCSVNNVDRVAADDEEMIRALDIVYAAMQDRDGEYASIAHEDTAALKAATDFLTVQWLPMVEATKHGIAANIHKILRAFSLDEELADGFATGAGDRLIPISELLSNKIKIVNVSQVEHGLAGRTLAVLLKTAFFRAARLAEQQDPEGAKARLEWWLNPQPGAADAAQHTLHVFVADEYQALMTSSGDGGNDAFSDAAVWNVMRSAGVAGVVLTQSMAAYRQAIGDKAADNMISNFRSRLYLATEDPGTIEQASKLAGKAMRFHQTEERHHESLAAVKRAIGVSPDALKPVKWQARWDRIPVFFTPGHFEEFTYAANLPAYELDLRHMRPATGLFESLDRHDLRDAVWRQEDKGHQAAQHGVQDADCVDATLMSHLTRGQAFAYIQRAGAPRLDVIQLLDH